MGSKCPKLKHRGHGSWTVRKELPQRSDGSRRKPFRRDGFDDKEKALVCLHTVRELLNLAGKDDDDQQLIADLLESWPKGKDLPTVDEVRPRLLGRQDLVDIETVGDWLDRWYIKKLRSVSEPIRDSTATSYEGHIRNYLKPKIGHIRKERLDEDHLEEMFASIEDDNEGIEANNDDRAALKDLIATTRDGATKRALRQRLAELPPYRRPVGPSSQQRILATLRKSLNDRIGKQRVLFNPAAHFRIPCDPPKPLLWTPERIKHWQRTGCRPGPVMVWGPELANQFLDYVAAHDPDNEAMWHLLIKRGPRRGEVAGLGWDDTQLGRSPSIDIRIQVTEVKRRRKEAAPKSEAGVRPVALDTVTAQLLEQHRARQLERKAQLGTVWRDSGKVFTKPDGSMLRPSWIGERFARLYTAAGLPPIRLHDLRHTAATLMLRAKNDYKVIQETLGHATLATTMDIYASVVPEVLAEAAEAVAALLPRRTPPPTSGHPAVTPRVLSPV